MSTPAGLQGLGRDVVRATRGHDPALHAAGVTFSAALHVMVLLGYVTTSCLDARDGHPLGAPVAPDRVATAA